MVQREPRSEERTADSFCLVRSVAWNRTEQTFSKVGSHAAPS